MIKYAKIINQETGLCEVGYGTDVSFYKSIGMLPLDVQQSDIDNYWYLAEKCPMKTDEQKANERKTTFENQFFQIPAIENVFVGGWYRKKPKGYASAVESLNTCFNAVLALNKLPADTLIFYTQPDYSNADECTEEWLIAHQFKNEEMTKEQFMQFYSVFMTVWNTAEH